MEGEEGHVLELYLKEVISSSCLLSALARSSLYMGKKKMKGQHRNLVPWSCFNEELVSAPSRNTLECERYRWRVLKKLLSTCSDDLGRKRRKWGTISSA